MWRRRKGTCNEEMEISNKIAERVSEALNTVLSHIGQQVLEQNAKAQAVIIDKHNNYLKGLEPQKEMEMQTMARVVSNMLPFYDPSNIYEFLHAADKVHSFITTGDVPADLQEEAKSKIHSIEGGKGNAS